MLLFTALCEGGFHFCCYLLYFVSTGVRFAVIYCGLRACNQKKLVFAVIYCGFIDFEGFSRFPNSAISLYILLKSAFLDTSKTTKMSISACKYCRFLVFCAAVLFFCCYLLHLANLGLFFACICYVLRETVVFLLLFTALGERRFHFCCKYCQKNSPPCPSVVNTVKK